MARQGENQVRGRRAELRRLQLLVHRAVDDGAGHSHALAISAGRALLDTELAAYQRFAELGRIREAADALYCHTIHSTGQESVVRLFARGTHALTAGVDAVLRKTKATALTEKGEPVTLHWDGPGAGTNCDPAGMQLASLRATSSGLISATVTVPLCAVPGDHPVLARGIQEVDAQYHIQRDCGPVERLLENILLLTQYTSCSRSTKLHC